MEAKLKSASTFWPRLTRTEWLIFGVLAAGLSVINIYTTLLTGWGDGGSIIAVIMTVILLHALGKRYATVETLNLGQTMASAGGTMGFSVCAFAAVRMLYPDWDPSMLMLIVMFTAMGFIAAMVGASTRKQMVKYYFPSGTACAVITRSLTGTGDEEDAKRPLRLLSVSGSIASLLAIPTKITFKKGGHALISDLSFGKGFGLAVDPLLYGIGIVVGPRIGIGMILGALGAMFVIKPSVPETAAKDWITWSAIAILTIPTFASIGFAYLFRQPANVPPGFTPGETTYEPHEKSKSIFGVLGLLSVIVTAFCAKTIFGLSWIGTIVTIAISWPLCMMNGRVTGETDINPVRLVAIVLLTGFAWFISGGAIALLGMAIVGGTLAGMAVDMMQDFRTGFLLDKNPNHQTAVQLVGSFIGAIASVPFIMYLDKSMGFGDETPLPAPGAKIWSAMAKAFAGDMQFPDGLVFAIVMISLIGSVYAFFTVWPKTARFMPSLFGAGIALLLPFNMSAAIFIGGLCKWIVVKRSSDAKRAGDDTMIVGSSIFAASALASVLIVLATAVMSYFGLEWFFMSGH